MNAYWILLCGIACAGLGGELFVRGLLLLLLYVGYVLLTFHR